MSHTQYTFPTIHQKETFTQLLFVSLSRYEKDWTSVLHSHAFCEIVYVIDGTGEFCTRHFSAPLQKDSLVIVNPNTKHTEVSSKETPLNYMVIGVNQLQFEFNSQEALAHKKNSFRMDLDTNGSSGVIYSEDHASVIFPFFKALAEELSNKEDSYERICRNYFETALIKIIRLYGKNSILKPSKSLPPECVQTKNYIDTYYIQPITLEMLADITNLNKYYLSHLFKLTYGIAPIQYLNERRIKRCKELLTDFDFNIAEIAELTGYASSSYFSQVFRKRVGMTPQLYRKKYSYQPPS